MYVYIYIYMYNAWQVNGSKGAYVYYRKQRVPGLPTCHYGSMIRKYPRHWQVKRQYAI